MMSSLSYAAVAFAGLLLASPVLPPINPNEVTPGEWAQMLERVRNGGRIDLGQRTVTSTAQRFQPARPVVIRGGKFGPAVLNQWRNVTFEGSSFSAPPGTPSFQSLVVINDAENLRIQNCHFTGYRSENGRLNVRGISVRGGRHISIEGSTFEEMAGFNGLHRAEDVKFVGNLMRSVREGVQIQGGSNILIERNRFEDFQPFGGDHADAIQFFTTGLQKQDDQAAHNVTIRNNLILASGKSQGIFMGDELKLASVDKGYKDVSIEGNVIIGAVWHGITAIPVDRLSIRRNRLLRLEERDKKNNRLTAGGQEVLVEDNEAGAYIFGEAVDDRRNRTTEPLSPDRMEAVVASWTSAFSELKSPTSRPTLR